MACFAGRNAAFTNRTAELAAWTVADPARFMTETVDRVFDHGLGEFIVSVHWLKTVLAVRDELARGVAEHTASLLLASLNRFLNSPLKRRHAMRTAYQARRFVERE
jgi:hypothetical protein